MSRTEPRQYRVLDVLGRGGFGTVYRAELRLPEGFVRDVALKVPNTTEADPKLLARLRDEARMLGLVHHRAIVGVDALVKVFDRWTVVMEFVDGTSLLALLRHHGPVPAAIALQIVEEVASGLHAAYVATDRDGRQLRLLHRDVKPSNVQLTRFGEVKLLDFGVARGEHSGPQREAATTGSVVYGSVPYLAPERLDLEDGHPSDIFALTLTLAQLITNRAPEGPSTDPRRHAEQVERWRSALAEAGAPSSLVDLVARGLAWEPSDRPDATELVRASRAIRAAMPDLPLSEWAAEHVAAVQRATPPVAGEYTGRSVAEAPTTEKHRHLSELFGTAIPTTFDDPTDAGAEATVEVPLNASEIATVVRPPIPAPVAAPPRRRRRWLLGLALLALGGALGALGTFAALTLGSSAMVGALVVAALDDPTSMCTTMVRNTRQSAQHDRVRGVRKGAAFFEGSLAACDTAGFWEVGMLMGHVTRLTRDGELSDGDRIELEFRLRELGR